ncbi:sarcosine oxidase subunit gamma [Aliishimia ponticola]|uniref:Sarcosine oxidase subunit gamma n=1 Tax=Aliishimia ponticola TaxID=2499833 RepID=A0A4S4NCC9_9RHOB|nr:sarcosine oxidase subunit gamma [Aliishimia ponticola]THH35691.1 sarcosine oxidase subunit gamma [Aliishimia ponticola]
MVEIVAKSAVDGLVPLEIGAQKLTEAKLGPLTSLMAYNGAEAGLAKALETAHGMALPGPNRATGKDGARAIWFGRGQVVLAGPEPVADLAEYAAVVDQSDAWACVELSGPKAEAVLARLVPLDLRAAHFKRGHTARTQIQHVNASVTRIGADRFLLMVFRSMAATLVHDLSQAMTTVAARG